MAFLKKIGVSSGPVPDSGWLGARESRIDARFQVRFQVILGHVVVKLFCFMLVFRSGCYLLFLG